MLSTDQKIIEAQRRIDEIKMKLRRGANYYDCKQEAALYINLLNAKGVEIAKEHKRKFYKITFTALMR